MPARRHRFPWLPLIVTALLLWAVLALSQGLAWQGELPFSVVIDGRDVTAGLHGLPLDGARRLLLAGAAVLLGLWLLLALPLALLLGVGAVLGLVLLLVLGSVGLPLLALGLLLGLLALPLLLLWWLLRWLIA